jgi:hypothetical protein
MSPKLRLRVQGSGGRVVISYASCGKPSSMPPAHEVGVESSEPDEEPERYCRLRAKDAEEIDIRGTWTYGTPVHGFFLGPCRDLVPGHYIADAIAMGHGFRHFDYMPNGQVVQGMGSCD